jgi:hypothetical protein
MKQERGFGEGRFVPRYRPTTPESMMVSRYKGAIDESACPRKNPVSWKRSHDLLCLDFDLVMIRSLTGMIKSPLTIVCTTR